LAGGAGSRLFPATLSVSKQLLPVYDKPMLFYSLSMLLLSGLRDIAVITTERDASTIAELLGDGSALGISLTYIVQPSPDGLAQAFTLGKDFIAGRCSTLMLGDNIFHGAGLRASLARAAASSHGATVFSYFVADPSRYGVVVVDADGRATELVEKPEYPRSHLAVTGLYFYDNRACDFAATLRPSNRGELEITDLNRLYLFDKSLRVERLGRGIAWLDTGTPESLLEASTYIASVERRQGLRIGAIEEVAFRQGFIDAAGLELAAQRYRGNAYGQYLMRVIEEPEASASTAVL
jgi:glucose-1-phosphate thymidylyltransferase